MLLIINTTYRSSIAYYIIPLFSQREREGN
jgi:hypothetical protein